MEKRLLLLLVFVWVVATGVSAQQRMRYSHYLQNAYLINPAVGGAESFLDMRAGYSHQWAGFKGAPKGVYLSLNQGIFSKREVEGQTLIQERVTSLPARGRSVNVPTTEQTATPLPAQTVVDPNLHLGVGGTVFSEITGPISMTGVGGTVSSHIRIDQGLRLGIGVGLEMMNYRFDPRNINLVNDNDVALAENVTNLLMPSLNAGFAVYTERFFLAGATRQLLKNRLLLNQLNPYVSTLEVHYVVHAGFRVAVGEDIRLTPSMALRYVNPAPAAIDLSLQGSYRDQFFAGFSYRHEDALVGMLGLRLGKTLTAQYAYDFTTSALRSYSSGTHSLVLGMRLGKQRMEERRYFW